MKRYLRWVVTLAMVIAMSYTVQAVTIQSFNGTGSNSATVEHSWDDSGNYTANGTVIATNVSVTTAATLPATTFTGAIVPLPKTKAQINALTSGTTGQIVVCSDCTQSSICTSSGTVNPGAWVVSVATGTFVGSTWSGFPHCQ